MRTSDFDFFLPEDLIAQKPLEYRDAARLLFANRSNQVLEHKNFSDIEDLFGENDVLVFNKSRVLPARVLLDAKTEIFLSEPISDNRWKCLIRPGKKFQEGASFSFDDGSTATVVSVEHDGLRVIEFAPKKGTLIEFLERFGQIPLPPYIKRQPNVSDSDRYQTVYAEDSGSVAAPTAGLHFTDEILQKLQKKGVQTEFITLHVGMGTFSPVKTENIEDHYMHSEFYEIDSPVAQRLNTAKKSEKKITAIGSTSLRSLESAADGTGFLSALSGKTDIFLYPPAQFSFVDHFFTNFHLPKSTLLMLLAAFAAPGKTNGRDFVMNAYHEAVTKKYRFFSYGDASLWW